MSSPPIPVPGASSRHSSHDSGSHSNPNEQPSKPVLSPGVSSKMPDDKKARRTSLQVILPKLPSSESLSYSPSSPGITSWIENSSRSADQPSPDKLHTPDADKLTRKESYKAQRKNYCREKKRVANELLSSLKDPSVIVLADWLKVRGTLKSWTKLWCILKPGLLLLYKSPKAKSAHWVGTILLNTCQVIERPSKKDGFCFKLFHPLEQSIWAPRGPEKETIGAVVQPLPTSYLIFRAPSQAAGKCWMDALELSLRCSSLLVRSMSSKSSSGVQDSTANHETQWSEADYEKHFTDHVDALPSIGRLLKTFCPRTPSMPHSKLLVVNSCSSRSTPTDFHLLQPHAGPSLAITPCPSPSPYFQQLYHAVAYMEQELEESSTSPTHASSPSPNIFVYPSTSSSHAPDIDIPQVSVDPCLETSDSPQVTLVPSPDLTDLDDISQPDVGTCCDHLSGAEQASLSESESEASLKKENQREAEEEPTETPYVHHGEEEFGSAGEQVEELPDEHKSLIWYLVKQVRPGMDLSKVVLPTFILEPRSFLDKLSDSYYHADIISQAVLEDDAFTRMKGIVKWYLSGFYKKPKGLKKPYNPILGETFRCYWKHPNGSRTFYLAEQVSHHPPVSAFYVTNRQDGFCISASILAKSKFYGNSTSAILDGVGLLTLLPRGESYSITIPYAHCKGILMGTLTMELGGKVFIECEKTGYRTEIEFKLKPFLGGAEQTNAISGRLKLGKETLATLEGFWDSSIYIKDRRTGEQQLFWRPTAEVRSQRLKRHTVPVDQQFEFESEKLWQHVSAAIISDDQVAATEEKTALEEAQRAAAKERKMKCVEWMPKYFEQDLISGQWVYKHADLRPWDPRNDVYQYEYNYIIQTKTRHQTPMIRTASIVSVDPQTVVPLLQTESRTPISALKSSKHHLASKGAGRQDSASSSPDGEFHSDSSQSEDNHTRSRAHPCCRSNNRMVEAITKLQTALQDHGDRLSRIQRGLEHLAVSQRERGSDRSASRLGLSYDLLVIVTVLIVLQLLFSWLYCRK